MGEQSAILLLFLLALAGANAPWLNERVFLVAPEPAAGKRQWVRIAEWLVYFGLVLGAGFGLEYRLTGEVYPQGWVFYVVNLCLFAVFALPGFIYRHDLRHYLRKRQRRDARVRTAAPQE